MSVRSEIAQRIASFILDKGLAAVYGGDVFQDKTRKGKPYGVGFSTPRNLDGEVYVYSDAFIQVTYQTRYHELPPNDSRVFTSETHALDFLRLAFVERKFQEALEIPTK